MVKNEMGKGGFGNGNYKAEANEVLGQADGIHQQGKQQKYGRREADRSAEICRSGKGGCLVWGLT